MISYASIIAVLSDRSVYTSFFRTVSPDGDQIQIMISVALELKWTLIAAAGGGDNYGIGGLDGFVKGAEAAGIIVVCKTILVSTNFANAAKEYAKCIQDTGANVAMLFSNEIEASGLLAIMNDTHTISSSLTFMASNSWAIDATWQYGISHYNGSFTPQLMRGTLGFQQQVGDQSWYKTCYGSLTPQNNNYSFFLDYWQTRFICKLSGAYPICNGTITGRSKTSPCLCTGNETLANDPADIRVAFVYDAVYAVVNAIRTIKTNCSAIKTAQLCNRTTISNVDLQAAIQELTFQGKSQFIQFNGADCVGSKYDVIQYTGSKWITVGSYTTDLGLHLNLPLMQWRTPDNSVPISQVEPTYLDMDEGVVIFFNTLASIMIFCALLTIGFFHFHSTKPILRASSPRFCHAMLFGLIMIWISIYLWAGKQTDSLCSAKLWVGFIGFSIVMGNLFAKTYRIWKIFDSKTLKVQIISDKELFLYSGVIVSIEVILLAILMHDPPRVVIKISSDSPLDQFQVCECESHSFENGMIYAFLAYNIFLVCSGSLLAFLTRNVASSFNESKWISMSMYNISVCLVVIAPIYYTAGSGNDNKRLYIIRSAATMFASTITYLALFSPKIHQLFTAASKEDRTARSTTAKRSSSIKEAEGI
eukprot:TRINITY_DN1723_c0_g3_i1.p1 TRINITY_DN1723_c0_g3~~TRINITY_DN1723_c0_g3_i1.p1  ORF type:complete len:646 (+),score=100.40 TRINITY_DN1723_c0_g3_i1:196-2133(+)